jgi:isochorismate synthase
MPAATVTNLITAGLMPLLDRARWRSRQIGRGVLASFTTHIGPAHRFDPAALVDSSAAFIWEQRERGFALAGVGQAARITASGPARFDEARTQLAQLLEDAIVQQESGAALHPTPLSLAGFAFDPERPDNVAWFGYPDALITLPRILFTRSGSHLFVTANALISETADTAAEAHDLAALAERLIAEAAVQPTDAAPSQLLDPGADAREIWGDSVSALTGAIATGHPDKVVLARRVTVESTEPFDARSILLRLRQRFAECTVFAVRSGESCFVGATPEMLVSLRGRRVRADCLAGTARRGATPDEDAGIAATLLSDEKELREHAIVARGIGESLAPFCADVRHPDEPGLRRMANVQHLHTPIEASTDGDRHVLELVEALHPTAATAGLPRAEALALIREQEPFSRGWYAGAIGWIDADGGGEFAVALRSGLLREDVATLYAGCGIVTGSQAEREWAESELKLAAMLHALNATPEPSVGVQHAGPLQMPPEESQ